MGANFPGSTPVIPSFDRVIKWPPIPDDTDPPRTGEIWGSDDKDYYEVVHASNMVTLRALKDGMLFAMELLPFLAYYKRANDQENISISERPIITENVVSELVRVGSDTSYDINGIALVNKEREPADLIISGMYWVSDSDVVCIQSVLWEDGLVYLDSGAVTINDFLDNFEPYFQPGQKISTTSCNVVGIDKLDGEILEIRHGTELGCGKVSIYWGEWSFHLSGSFSLIEMFEKIQSGIIMLGDKSEQELVDNKDLPELQVGDVWIEAQGVFSLKKIKIVEVLDNYVRFVLIGPEKFGWLPKRSWTISKSLLANLWQPDNHQFGSNCVKCNKHFKYGHNCGGFVCDGCNNNYFTMSCAPLKQP